MKRRTLFRQIGSILAMLGLTETTWLTLSNRYYQALAQTNSPKLALLIGINQYPQFPVLSGCLNDVQMQRELFGLPLWLSSFRYSHFDLINKLVENRLNKLA